MAARKKRPNKAAPETQRIRAEVPDVDAIEKTGARFIPSPIDRIASFRVSEPVVIRGDLRTPFFHAGDTVHHPIAPLLLGRVVEVFTSPERNGIWVKVNWEDGTTSEHSQLNVRRAHQ